MKKIKFIAGVAIMGSIILSSCAQKDCSKANLGNEVDSVSYALGINMGMGISNQLKSLPGGELNKEAIIAGFIQSINNDTASYKISGEDIYTVIDKYFGKMQKEDELKKAQESAEAIIKNKELLAQTKETKGMNETESGLQYKIIKDSNGKKPAPSDVVKVHYTGKLLDGTVFASSVERGEPLDIPVGAVIPGWSEALLMMPVGSKWELIIPSELGYGGRQVGSIPANSILNFEVELLDIVPQNNEAEK